MIRFLSITSGVKSHYTDICYAIIRIYAIILGPKLFVNSNDLTEKTVNSRRELSR